MLSIDIDISDISIFSLYPLNVLRRLYTLAHKKLTHIYWLLSSGFYILDPIYIGSYILAPIYWSLYTGSYILAPIYPIHIGSYLLIPIYWLLHILVPIYWRLYIVYLIYRSQYKGLLYTCAYILPRQFGALSGRTKYCAAKPRYAAKAW